MNKQRKERSKRRGSSGDHTALLKGLQQQKGRTTNKISIEQLVKLKSDNFDSEFLDATIDMAKTRGSTQGLPLANFVRTQLKHDQKQAVDDVLKRAKSALSSEERAPSRSIVNRYWEDKVRVVSAMSRKNKSYIDDEPILSRCTHQKEKPRKKLKASEQNTDNRLIKRQRLFQVYTIKQNDAKSRTSNLKHNIIVE